MTEVAVAAEPERLFPDTAPPSYVKQEKSLDQLVPGLGEPQDGKPSRFYHYPPPVFSDFIDHPTREWLNACWHDVRKVRQKLSEGVNIHTANANGFTGLHMAAAKFELEIARVLVDAGHDVNIEDCNGETPLDACFDNGALGEGCNRPYEAMVAFLESKGALRKVERSWMQAANQAKYAPQR
mmetsp:Transcript_62232/g.148497  ORF Transcript_62232/g.148497 Transcript_62232/m.148497 type:complete len:182 (+) Transcript_62232:73-618(+)